VAVPPGARMRSAEPLGPDREEGVEGRVTRDSFRFERVTPLTKETFMITTTPSASPAAQPYRVDISRGRTVGRVSSEWYSRPDDEKYLSLTELYASVRQRADGARTRIIESRAIRVEARADEPERLSLRAPDDGTPLSPTHWSFGQLCSLIGAPAAYMRALPAALAGINVQHGLIAHRGEQIKLLEVGDGAGAMRTEMRAVTGPDYGRIWDHELVSAVMTFAGDGVGDTRWKVPGVLDWGSMTYNPYVDVDRDTTTLYASDRDVFLFLVDDTHPIEAGKLPNGDPDLFFRGFYAWNSEVGAKALGVATFYLRAVCMNRNLWGVENFEEVRIRHSKFAANRFAQEAAPALTRFADSSPRGFIEGIRTARERIVARSDEAREDFLRKRGFSKPDTARIIAAVLAEEGHPPASLFDFVQGITAVARTRPPSGRAARARNQGAHVARTRRLKLAPGVLVAGPPGALLWRQAMPTPRLRARYRAALRSMSPNAWRVFWMHRVQDREIAEIAIALGLPHPAVEDLLAAAIVHIDRALQCPAGGDS
jgi:hypothetical protein